MKSTLRFQLITIFAVLLLGVVTLAACSAAGTDQPAATGTVSFSQDVLPILESKCIRCHGDSRQSGDLVLTSYASLMTGGRNGVAIVAGDAAGSLLVQMVESGKMPKAGLKLSSSQIQTITDWVNAGAQDN